MLQTTRQLIVESSKNRYMQKGKKTEWTDERIEILRKFYQVEPNDKVAERLGISSRTLVRKAKELQLYKPQAVTKSVGIEETVRDLSAPRVSSEA